MTTHERPWQSKFLSLALATAIATGSLLAAAPGAKADCMFSFIKNACEGGDTTNAGAQPEPPAPPAPEPEGCGGECDAQ